MTTRPGYQEGEQFVGPLIPPAYFDGQYIRARPYPEPSSPWWVIVAMHDTPSRRPTDDD